MEVSVTQPLVYKVSIDHGGIQIKDHQKVKHRPGNGIVLARVWVKKVILHPNYQQLVS